MIRFCPSTSARCWPAGDTLGQWVPVFPNQYIVRDQCLGRAHGADIHHMPETVCEGSFPITPASGYSRFQEHFCVFARHSQVRFHVGLEVWQWVDYQRRDHSLYAWFVFRHSRLEIESIVLIHRWWHCIDGGFLRERTYLDWSKQNFFKCFTYFSNQKMYPGAARCSDGILFNFKVISRESGSSSVRDARFCA